VAEGQNHRKFNFDYIFDESTSQSEVYAACEVDHLIEKALRGYHATIFAYGQTGSGKTYTMHGDELLEGQAQGIIPLLFRRLFEQVGAVKGRSFVVSLSFLQIYSERVYDLLNTAGNARAGQQGLRLRWSKDEQFTVENLFVYECQSAEDLMLHFRAGLKNRINAAHKLNLQSSRSHSILSIRIESYDPFDPSSVLASRIELVDLAGSERIGLTGTEGRQAKESIDINKSLFTLRQVITVLAEGGKGKRGDKAYVPYRDSKLTSILKQSIGGNSYCLMLACLCPHDLFL
jgi:kinesin family protein 4/21/27